MLDIDKQYIMGYSVSDSGYIYTQTKENSPRFMQEMALKNRIVSKIHNILLNPRNQINLTQPVTVDQIKALAKKSSMGLAARYMNGWDPSSKYRMQIENMVGKAVIGNVATAIKSFFALSNLYNTKFREIYSLIMSGNYDVAREMLKKYTFTRNGKLLTLANTNLEIFSAFESLIFPENQKDLQQILLDLKKNVDLIEDQSMILGALLNSATDNAKELILKKINADANWVDIYCVSLMLGDKIDTIGDFMLDPIVSEIINNFENSIFDIKFVSKESLIKTKIHELESDIQNLLKSKRFNEANELIDSKRKLETLLECIWAVEEIQRLGKMLKINQGIPTNLEDFYVYVKSIENYIKKRLNTDFDIHRFILDEDYKQLSIRAYERVKRNFNILEVIAEVPHFAEMFKTISVNRRILDRLSVRNELTNRLLDDIYHKVNKIDYKTGEEYIAIDPHSILNEKERTALLHDITDFLINQWILQANINVTVPIGVLDYVAEDKLYIQDVEHIEQLRNYIEQFVIPVLKEQLPENKFIASLTLGIKQGKAFFKLPFNMLQIDNTQKTRSEYESVLLDFNKLREVQIQGIDMNLIDIFYLYNLIVNKDKFGPNSLTRIFEDILSLDEDHTLLIWNFNDWIDQQDVDVLFFDFFKTYKDWKDFSRMQAFTFNTETTPKSESKTVKSIDIDTISPKTESFGVVFPKQGKTSQALKSEYQQWQIDNPTGIVAYRVKFPYNTVEEVQLGHIGNPFSENDRGANTVQQFYDWLVTGNNFGNEKATDEYRRAIISKLLSTPANSPILYYTELGRPSHATVLGYLISNKQLLSNQSSPKVEIYQGSWTRADVASQTDKVFLFGDNTEDRIMGHIPIRTQAVIRGLPNAIGIDTKKNRGTSEPKLFHISSEYNVKPGSVVVYNNSRYLVRRINDSGRVQLYKEDGSKYPGTPLVGSIQQVLGYFPIVSYNNHEYIVTDNGNIYSTAKEGGLSYINTSPERTRILEEAKKYMTTNSSYFTDTDFDIFKAQVDEAIQRAINSGKTIVIPADGIGTGKAELAKRAPKLFAYLQQKLNELQNLNSENSVQLTLGLQQTHDTLIEDLGDDEIVDSAAEEPVTIGFNNTDEHADNEFSNVTLHIDSDYITDIIPVYQTTPSIQSKLIELIRQANENGIKGIHVVTSADLIHESPEIQNAKGFVRDGEIYINVNRAGDDTVIHEFGHIYLAYAKVTNPDAYYTLLEKVRKTELWAKMKTWYVYRNKVGSDFDEEVLATIIGNYYNKQSVNQEEAIALEAIALLSDDFKQLFESDILPTLDDTFIDNYRLSQKIATKKSQLLIKEDC